MNITKKELYSSQVERRKSRSRNAKRIATSGEEMVACYLKTNRYKILARNFRSGRTGEIDIVALSPEDLLVFVEVKTRTLQEPEFGIPEIGFDAVGYHKQRKILAVSSAFMAKHELNSSRWRYDVVVVLMPHGLTEAAVITHVKDAFS